MKLNVKNVGCISSAQINVKGLTIIAGANGSGKSTLSKILFSVIKAVANIAQENDESKYIMLNKYVKSLYMRFDINIVEKGRELFPAHFRSFADAIWDMRGTDSLLPYLEKRKEFIANSDVQPRVRTLMLKDLSNITNLMDKEDHKGLQMWAEIRYFVESEFMNQITTEGKDWSEVEFIWDEKRKYGIKFQIQNDDLKMVSFIPNNALEDATYVESPLYMPIVDSLRRSATYVENMRRSIIQPMVPLHVKDIVNKYDLLSNLRNSQSAELLERIMNIIGGHFVYDEAQHNLFFISKQNHKLMPINVASGVKSFGLLQVLLQIAAISANKPLIWDEPENHLHPEWQIKFAEILVALAQGGIPVVISTHSPYFIQSVRYFASKYNIEPFVNYYLADMNGDGLATVNDVSNDLNQIFVKLASPLNAVMNIPNNTNTNVPD